MHSILRRGPRAPAHTRPLAITLQILFYTTYSVTATNIASGTGQQFLDFTRE